MRFFAHDLALTVIRQLRPLVRYIRLHDRKLAGQLTEAGSSMTLNLGEGNRRLGRDRKHLFTISSGSAEEVRDALLVAVAWGYLKETQPMNVLDDLDHFQAILWKLTH